ncbi:hypothetical protein MMC17_008640 [Xylographa soralifera]|nr:hypothetical protein [Xylographa soralifera]
MDSLKFDTLISEPGLFEPAAYPGNAFFEIWRNESESQVREGNLMDGEVEDWVNQSGRFAIPKALDENVGYDKMRLMFNPTATITAHSFNANTRTTTGIILQTDDGEAEAIKERIVFYKASLGCQLLLQTILVNISLVGCADYLWDLKQDVLDIEHSTGQHTWDSYKARDEKPKPDVELSRKAHGLRIEIPDLCRRVNVASIWIELLLESLTQDQGSFATKGLIIQWLENMKIQAKMAKLDAEFIAKRVDNQVGAVYNRFAQRDNITMQKISEATNRDSSAMRSLAVLGALFLPGTFVATLFSINSLQEQPLWVYWVITIPLTLLVLAAWIFWTRWRIEDVRRQELVLDEKVIA